MKRRILSALLSFCMILTLLPGTAFAASSDHPFTDVPDGVWYSDAVQYVYEHGLMNGTSPTKFSPDAPTSRGMIVTILHRMEGTPSAARASFTDVPTGQYYTEAVAWASANQIVTGYGDGRFAPDDPITREQMAAILYRYVQYKNYDDTASDSVSAFADGSQVSSFAVTAMNWAIGEELLSGVGNNMIAPTGNASRAQVATILMRFCENIVPKEPEVPETNTYRVTFELNYPGAGTYRVVEVEEGKTVTAPASPSRSGYAFDGWYTAAIGGSKFNFSTAVTSNLTLYAHWILANTDDGGSSGGGGYTPDPISFTVTFDSNGGSAVPAQTVKKGEMVTAPADPTKEGYVFVGWYSDIALESAYDFNVAVVADMTVYAKWRVIDENKMLFIDSEAYSSLPDEENIVEDEESGLEFVNNELIIHAEIGTNRNDVVALLNSFGGEIIGEIPVTDTYQVQFTNTYTWSELVSLQSSLESNPLISWASTNAVCENCPNYYPVSDTEWADDWGDTNPKGLNWGVEAIEAPEAWKYRELMTYVNVGVYDCCFYDHDDLRYQKTYFNNPQSCTDAHGTHVAGTIAAGFDNNVGITGVAPYVNLYGFGYESKVLKNETVLMVCELSVTALLHNDKCHVLNCSNGVTYNERGTSLWAAEGYTEVMNAVDSSAQELGNYLERLINLGDKHFVICVSAGNENDEPYTNAQGETVTGNVDAYYNSFYTAITNYEVKNRIIVVGACGNNEDGTYTYSDFSNVGSRVDVVAPGEDIYSTINNNGYYALPGTSMATPHVAGIAAMLFAIDPNLTGDHVKKIIVDTATTEVSGCSYKMVNAKNAVEYVARHISRQISGQVISDDTELPISGVTVQLNCVFDSTGNGIGATAMTGIDGKFRLTIPENAITVTGIQFEKDGYSSYLFPLAGVNPNSSFDIGTVRLTPIADPVLTPAISGIVKDADTGLALDNVDVYVYDADGDEPLVTGNTGRDGVFSITLEKNGTYRMKFSKEGYEDYELNNLSVTGETLIGVISLTSTDSIKFSGGDGSEEHPYQIETAEQLDAIRNRPSAHYELIADIDLTSFGEWTPVGSNLNPFNGTLDGNNHSIIGMTIHGVIDNGKQYAGMFAVTSGVRLTNLELVDEVVNFVGDASTDYTYSGNLIAHNVDGNVDIMNCHITSTLSHKTTSSSSYACAFSGGILGRSDGETTSIINCSITGSTTLHLSPADSRSQGYLGGVTGYCPTLILNGFTYNGEATITSANAGNSCYLGGVVASCSALNIFNCQLNINISGTNPDEALVPFGRTHFSTGGIAGSVAKFNFENVSVVGDVTSYSEYGDNYVGGLIGEGGSKEDFEENSLKDCHYVGTIRGRALHNYIDTWAGGFIGYLSSACSVEGSSVQSDIDHRGYYHSTIYTGGLIGEADDKLTVKNCTISGTLKPSAFEGASPTIYLGAVVGYAFRRDVVVENTTYNTEYPLIG